MKISYQFTLIKILVLGHLSVLCASKDFDFFYFVQQWPGSYCDTENGCCFPTTGKPAANFGIHGLWPNFNNGSYPSDCDPNNPYNEAEEWPSLSCPSSNGSTFWAHEWNKHGTCSESVLDQHAYFESALNLKADIVLLQILENAGIKPNGEFYSLVTIRKAIKEESGFTPGITCNVDARGNNQLYQIYLCVDSNVRFFRMKIAVPRLNFLLSRH